MFDNTAYLCEIAFLYWATELYKRHLDSIPEEWIGYNEWIKFYESIYQEAISKAENQSLLQSIYDIIHNDNEIDKLFQKFLSSINWWTKTKS